GGTLRGGSGDDTIIVDDGSTGSWRLYGEDGNDDLTGGNGDDFLYGGNGSDRLYGGGGSDRLYGNAGNDFLNGGAGDDQYIFVGDWGADTVTDGAGDTADVLDFSAIGNSLTFNLGANNAYKVFAGSNSVNNSDMGADIFLGGSVSDTFNVTKTAANNIILRGNGRSDTYNATFGALAGKVTVDDDGGRTSDFDYLNILSALKGDLSVSDVTTGVAAATGAVRQLNSNGVLQEVNFDPRYTNVERLQITAQSAKVQFVSNPSGWVADFKGALAVDAANITWSGGIRAGSIDFKSASGYAVNYDLLTRNNGQVSLYTTSGDITLTKGIYSASANLEEPGLVGDGSGTIRLITKSGGIRIVPANWLMASPNKLEWALRLGRFDTSSLNLATGEVRVSGAASYEELTYYPNGTVLRSANGAFVQSKNGNLVLESTLGVGAVDSSYLYTISPYSLYTQVASFTATVPQGQTVYLIEMDGITNSSASSGGNARVVTLSGSQNVPNPIVSNLDVLLQTDSVNLTKPVTSTQNITIQPTHPSSTLLSLIQSELAQTGLVLSQSELNNINTAAALFFGSADLLTKIEVGVSGNKNLMIFTAPTVVLRGDTIKIYSPIKSLNFIIVGDGSSTYLSADIDAVFGDVGYFSSKNNKKLFRRYSSKIFTSKLLKKGFMPAHPT
ncbi:MAG: calcium-binding protein, partial [Verrucomicrobia bacterium]|nr:calcium-binding protein [Verrucomicrobiota bacterium]